MHVTPSDLHMVRQDRMVIRFVLHDTMAFARIAVAGIG